VDGSPVTRAYLPGLWAVLALALIARVALLLSNAVSFHSDEAVVALMARHILDGARPVFFYGQAYMGSLDAWIVALAFALGGESVLSIRLAQSALYLGVVAVGYGAAYCITSRLAAALIVGVLLAVPPVLLALYTTATLGGYNEVLLLGGLLWWLAWDVAHEHARSRLRWLLIGLCAGLGWWSNALIVIYALPAGLLILTRLAQPDERGAVAGGIALALLAFAAGSLPWWLFNLQNDFAGLTFLLGSAERGGFAGTDVFTLPLDQRLIGLFLLGTPTLIGLRFPWSADFFTPLVGLAVLSLFAVALIGFARLRWLSRAARWYVLGTVALFALIYLASRFSFDPTGRYFLPVALPLYITLAAAAAALRAPLRALLVLLIVGYFAAGQISAALNPPGLTTQFNLDTHLPNDDDAALIAFLDTNGLTSGYTHYWIAFRLAFLSGERLQYSAALPYKPDLSYTPLDERYPPYRAAADAHPRPAYITAPMTPPLAQIDARLEQLLAAQGVSYQMAQVGIFRVWYDFAPAPIRLPSALGESLR
jgi:4-amino-4-deoxy-L-arabinose transferase-like glycosyltransferase